MTAHVEHAYSPKQYSAVVELWRRLLDCPEVSAYEVQEYGHHQYRVRIDDEHLYELVLSDGAETDDVYPVELTLVSYSDYGGSDLDAANVRELADLFAWVNTSTDGVHGAGEATVVLGQLPPCDDPYDGINQLEYLVETIEGLSYYGLISDETHSQYIDALAYEAWDQYLGSDVRSEVESLLIGDAYSGDFDDFGFGDDEIRDLYYGHENEWTAETATSVVNGRHDEAVSAIADEIIRAWRTPKIDPAQLNLI